MIRAVSRDPVYHSMMHEGTCPMVFWLSRSFRSTIPVVLLASLIVGAVVAGCSGGPSDGDGEPADAGQMDADPADTGGDADDPGDEDAAEPDTSDADVGTETFLCTSCSEDSDCGGDDDQCRTLDGEDVCTKACDLEADDPCPDTYQCARVEEDSSQGQCIPEQLTCNDFCEQTSCEEGLVCDPLLKECREPLGLCDTECTIDSVCGDGPEDRCLSLFPDNESVQERICATGCNPEEDVSQCPVDHRCVQVDPEGDPSDGVCFPLRGTCEDRCADAECGEDENCDEITGECVPAEYGACEAGCESNAECGGQEDWCLNLFEGEGSHCYSDCSDGETCPSGYACTSLSNSTRAFCVPESQRCDECEGTDCYPDGVCDPTSGMCSPIDRDCTVTGCGDGEVCDPQSTDCVAVGRSCSGDSWAADCDNVATTCTTHRSGTTGSCERICDDDSECPGEGTSCVETNFRGMCLTGDLGGPRTCGTLRRDGTQVGAPCGSNGDCSGDADVCIDGGGIDGFCSTSCESDTDCSGAQRCGSGPDGDSICLPSQCECAADVGFSGSLRTGLRSALDNVDLDQCEVAVDARAAGGLEQLSATPLASERLEEWLELPLVGQRHAADSASGLDDASDSPESVLEHAAEAAGLSISPSAGDYSFGGSNAKLTQAATQLINAAGGTPDTGDLEDEAQDVPADVQDAVAPIVAAVADAYTARQQAFDAAGWDTNQRQQAFEGAPYLFLPGTSGQEMNAPDLGDQNVRQTYAQFPDQQLAAAAGDLNATVAEAVDGIGDTSGWSGFEYVVDTPAGKIVIGGNEDDTYEPTGDLSGEIAVLIDVGGDDTYRVQAGANESVSNGVSLLVDLGGSDTYSYPKDEHSLDTEHLLTSDADGRKQPSGPLAQNNGPVSLSTGARQGGGRVGIGMLHDYGTGDDAYESLRMSQGASVFGVGLLFDGGGDDAYDAEALAQGGALGGLGVLWSAGGPDDYRVWRAGQGFGAASGTGVAFDRGGADSWEAVPGEGSGDGVLYLSTADRGASNGNLSQGAGAGLLSDASTTGLAGGFGLLRDTAGDDTYTSGTSAQGIGSAGGVGVLSEGGGGDVYTGRALVQGVGRYFGGGVVRESGGNDEYNTGGVRLRGNGQGYGTNYGWGVLAEMGGDDQLVYSTPGGGVGLDGGLGFALFDGGEDQHELGSPSGWGSADNGAAMGEPLYEVQTVGVFVDVGGDDDTYDRPQIDQTNIGNDSTWLQPDPSDDVEKGSGLDD